MEEFVHFEVDRRDHASTRVVVQDRPPVLAEGQVLFSIDRFALSANNITYALVGDQLDYWGFFPVNDRWGRIPAMGWADVIESNHPEIAAGGRTSWLEIDYSRGGDELTATYQSLLAGRLKPNRGQIASLRQE